MKGLLALRRKMNRKRPSFLREGARKHKRKARVGLKWRRPTGLQAKTRLQIHGKPAVVKVGYRNPAAVRGLDPSGLFPVRICSVSGLKNFDVKTQGVLLARVGNKKRCEILTECNKLGAKVLNVKNVEAKIKLITDRFVQRKERKIESAKKKEAKKKERKKVKETQKKVSADDQKKEEREQMEQVLTSR